MFRTYGEKLQDSIARADAFMERCMRETDENDSSDSVDEMGRKSESLKEKIKKARQRKAEYEDMLGEMKRTGKNEISLTDPESRLMRTMQGLDGCYNVQTAVDSKYKLMAAYDAPATRPITTCSRPWRLAPGRRCAHQVWRHWPTSVILMRAS